MDTTTITSRSKDQIDVDLLASILSVGLDLLKVYDEVCGTSKYTKGLSPLPTSPEEVGEWLFNHSKGLEEPAFVLNGPLAGPFALSVVTDRVEFHYCVEPDCTVEVLVSLPYGKPIPMPEWVTPRLVMRGGILPL